MDTRSEIIESCRKMNRLGLNQGASGNVSARSGDGFLITPSGLDYDVMTPADIMEMDFKGDFKGKHKPSGEWRIHRDILAERRDVQAVIHAHSLFCTTLSIHGLAIPAIHYMITLLGGDDIPCVPYAPPLSQKLSDRVLPALENRRACLMAHHGVVVIASTLERALKLLSEVENLAAQYWHALQIGTPPVLSSKQMKAVHEIMKDYGGGMAGKV